MTDMTQQEFNNMIRRQDADNSWRKYQVDYPEATQGNFALVHFSIPPWDKKRLQTIRGEGLARDPGSGNFTKLSEFGAVEKTKGNPKGERTWMSDTHAEILEHTPILNKLFYSANVKHKRVLVNGLGLGLVVHAALTFDSVAQIDVVEKNPDVIELVGQYLIPAYPRLKIHLGDAYDIAWPPGTRWDLAWHDIWPTIDDGNLRGMDHLMRKYKNRVAWQGCWQREGCLAMAGLFRQIEAGTLPMHKALEFIEGRAPWLK